MGLTGAVIMTSFAGVFWLVGLGPQIGWKHPLLLLPIIFLAAVIARVVAVSRGDAADPERARASAASARAEKIIARASAAEGIAIFVASFVLSANGHRDVVLPAIAAIVGLHFLPIAYAVPFKPFYAIAFALLAAAAIGFTLGQPAGTAVSGAVAAAALWLASLAALRRAAKVRASNP